MAVLDRWHDFVVLFLLVGVLGAIGGLTYELLQSIRGRTGLIERPEAVGRRYLDLGLYASLIIGAVASVAALWVFPPEITTTVVEGGLTTTSSRYDIVKVVGLSLIVGSAGGSFISAMQARAMALVKAQEADHTKQVASSHLATLEKSMNEGASPETLQGMVGAARSALAATGGSTSNGNPRPDDF